MGRRRAPYHFSHTLLLNRIVEDSRAVPALRSRPPVWPLSRPNHLRPHNLMDAAPPPWAARHLLLGSLPC